MKQRIRVVASVVLVLGALLWATGNVVADLDGQSPLAQPDEPGGASTAVVLAPSVPSQMPYQGVLRDGSGNLVDGTHDLTFKIYRYWITIKSTAWDKVWEETQTVNVANGLFSVLLGSQQALDPDVFDGVTLFGGGLELGVSVDGGAELSPRTALVTVPYAFRAQYAMKHPEPSYNSGWQSILIRPDPITETFTHNLGGDADDYVVDLQCKYRGRTFQGRSERAYVSDITDTTVSVWVGGSSDPDAIRLRIWRIK